MLLVAEQQQAILDVIATELASNYPRLSVSRQFDIQEIYARDRVLIYLRSPYQVAPGMMAWKSVKQFVIFINCGQPCIMRLYDRYVHQISLEDPDYLETAVKWMYPHWFNRRRSRPNKAKAKARAKR